MKLFREIGLSLALIVSLSACTGIPKNVEPVAEVELEKYLGKWHEIARSDNRFERGLTKVTAEYSSREGGGINVKNRGWDEAKQEWKQADGKAFRVSEDLGGHFKVSFFGPFYASYIVYELGENYEYAFVSGNTKKYLWLLAREPKVSDELLERFKHTAKEKGFDISGLVYP